MRIKPTAVSLFKSKRQTSQQMLLKDNPTKKKFLVGIAPWAQKRDIEKGIKWLVFPQMNGIIQNKTYISQMLRHPALLEAMLAHL